MIRLYWVFLVVLPVLAHAETLQQSALPGEWVPSGEMPRTEEVFEYVFTVGDDFHAKYSAIGSDLQLECEYKPSSSQETVFVWYCFLDENHLITLSLAGWSLDSGRLLYGYEYWLGYPDPGEIHGGLPVSLRPKDL